MPVRSRPPRGRRSYLGQKRESARSAVLVSECAIVKDADTYSAACWERPRHAGELRRRQHFADEGVGRVGRGRLFGLRAATMELGMRLTETSYFVP